MDNIKELAENIVRKDIYCCQTHLVEKLIESEVFSFDDIENLYFSDEQILENHYYDVKELNDIEQESFIETLRNDNEDYQEIFEYWLVSPWLAAKLKDIEEPVIMNEYGNWWGRTCTGQAILLDGTLQCIVKKYLIDNCDEVSQLPSAEERGE